MAAAENPSIVAAASASPLEEELQCPICREDLSDPVSVECGHNFCRACISHYCEAWEELGDLECPLCKKRIKKGNLRPNWQLANIVEKMKHLGKEDLCVRHKEKLHLFCKEDTELVCLFCERSAEHRSHTVLLLEEAAEEYKADFQDHVRSLVNQQERILKLKLSTKKDSKDLLKQVNAEKEKTVTEFRQLHQFLEEQETSLVAQIEEVEKQIETRRDEHMTRLSMELSSIESLIQEMQEKLNQSTREFLKNVECTTKKWRTRENLESFEFIPRKIKFTSQKFCVINSFLEKEIKQFKASLRSELERINATTIPDSKGFQDPLIGHCKSVRRGGKYIYHDHQGQVPPFSELQQPSREDNVRREENSWVHLSAKKSPRLISIYGSESDSGDSFYLLSD